MFGAILGDIIGSHYEFDRGNKTKDFSLFDDGCEFTDDTVMTIAVADGLMRAGIDASDNEIKENIIDAMHYWVKNILMQVTEADFQCGYTLNTENHITVSVMDLR